MPSAHFFFFRQPDAKLYTTFSEPLVVMRYTVP
jgi:hypothetical protein